MTYSIAIRTLGTGGDNYRRLLESITRQSVQPERVVIYIARGHAAPDYRVGSEEYVWVSKGMLAQRALRYDEISSDCIMLVDDDVELAPDTADKMLGAIVEFDADCVAADTFLNHCMSRAQKWRAAVAGLVLPSRTQKRAFRMRRCGAFSYISRPVHGGCYPSDTAAGPCSMWRRQSLIRLHIEHELWVERCGFAYGEDSVYYMKLKANGKRLYVLFDSGAVHLDTGSSSG
ncbi:MAG: glycosyltransferase, partial [Muribaculaceae bacterium]|nr:glycosyltransferase [Muribaculaceae bacterium]